MPWGLLGKPWRVRMPNYPVGQVIGLGVIFWAQGESMSGLHKGQSLQHVHTTLVFARVGVKDHDYRLIGTQAAHTGVGPEVAPDRPSQHNRQELLDHNGQVR